MSCALASPADEVCANKRPVQAARRASAPRQAAALDQGRLVPLAAGHARVDERPAAAASTPFAADAPEATFSMAQLRTEAPAPEATFDEPLAVPSIRTAPPSFREIRSGRAAAAGRAPVAEIRIPVAEAQGETLLSQSHAHAPTAIMPGMDQLVERVRQRTAARLSRGSRVPTPA